MQHWFVPCNTKHFDLVKHFETHRDVIWRAKRRYCSGDQVYIYLSSPSSQIKYRCIVLEEHVEESVVKQEAPYAITTGCSISRYVRFGYDCEFADGSFTYDYLISNGLGTVQAQAQMPRKLLMRIQKVEESCTAKGQSSTQSDVS